MADKLIGIGIEELLLLSGMNLGFTRQRIPDNPWSSMLGDNFDTLFGDTPQDVQTEIERLRNQLPNDDQKEGGSSEEEEGSSLMNEEEKKQSIRERREEQKQEQQRMSQQELDDESLFIVAMNIFQEDPGRRRPSNYDRKINEILRDQFVKTLHGRKKLNKKLAQQRDTLHDQPESFYRQHRDIIIDIMKKSLKRENKLLERVSTKNFFNYVQDIRDEQNIVRNDLLLQEQPINMEEQKSSEEQKQLPFSADESTIKQEQVTSLDQEEQKRGDPNSNLSQMFSISSNMSQQEILDNIFGNSLQTHQDFIDLNRMVLSLEQLPIRDSLKNIINDHKKNIDTYKMRREEGDIFGDLNQDALDRQSLQIGQEIINRIRRNIGSQIPQEGQQIDISEESKNDSQAELLQEEEKEEEPLQTPPSGDQIEEQNRTIWQALSSTIEDNPVIGQTISTTTGIGLWESIKKIIDILSTGQKIKEVTETIFDKLPDDVKDIIQSGKLKDAMKSVYDIIDLYKGRKTIMQKIDRHNILSRTLKFTKQGISKQEMNKLLTTIEKILKKSHKKNSNNTSSKIQELRKKLPRKTGNKVQIVDIED